VNERIRIKNKYMKSMPRMRATRVICNLPTTQNSQHLASFPMLRFFQARLKL